MQLATRNKTMQVACLVYYLPPGKDIVAPVNCDPKEVRAAGWAPLEELTADVVYDRITKTRELLVNIVSVVTQVW